MQLIDRYLYAVGRHLPKERRDDILAELRANILEMAEDREQELGRPLTIAEEEEILKKHGHPMQVASRYLPKRYLIGPGVFPFYWYTMRIVLPWVMLLYTVANFGRFITEPVTVQRLVEIVFGFFPVAFYFAAWMTLVFGLLEYARENYMSNPNLLYSWKPSKLPQVPQPQPEVPEKRPNPIFDFIGSLFGLAFLIMLRQHPMWILGPAMNYPHVPRPAAIWTTVYEMAIVFVSIQLAMKGMVIFSPNSRGWRIATMLVTKLSAITIIGFLLTANEFVVPGPGSDASLNDAVRQINFACHLGWRAVMIIVVLQFFWEIAKLAYPKLRSVKQLPKLFLVP
ncbi:hypothetical protein Acid345_1799 [Candidatus Koribacter versatilis Ellin345]|uniref:Uncharacterized protein n=1 Tax=Koribacter versatilis (strain Ellin345) TaxID=204669 RepID=Q1IQQ0_KORVE|nr:hypothetical protein [Candidatus Koribacter versatilis]ABF40800.1 hypothetical protein Acid345_1799 [Candidatus Koribacter versatilis Ellin345]